MNYKYKAINSDNKVMKGTINVESVDEVKKALENIGLRLISCKVKKEKYQLITPKLKLIELSQFAKKLSLLLKSGMTINKALEVLLDSIKHQKLKQAISETIKNLNIGGSFSASLKKYPTLFPKQFIAMVKISEVLGNLDQTMAYLADYYAKEHRLKAKLLSSLTYPIILSFLTILIFFVLILFVIPKFQNVFISMNIKEIPKFTLLIFKASDFIKRYFVFILFFVFLVFVIFSMICKRKNSYVKDKILVKFFLFKGLNTWVLTSRFTRCLSLMYASGISLMQAFMQTSSAICNKYIEDKLKKSSELILKGSSLSFALRQINFFPSMVIEMIEIGEKTNSVKDVLQNLSDYYDKETETAIVKMTQLVEPFIIIFIALIITIVILAIFLPMFSVMNQIVG